MSGDDKYRTAYADRQSYIDRILNSSATKKVVVAGPGTGKTYLFKKILAGKTPSLTLTFVNSLVDDLSLELCGMSEVRTLHGFARQTLKDATGFDIAIYPKLSRVIGDDARLLLGVDVDFDKAFNTRDDNNIHLDFYRRHRSYYSCYGYTDIIFAAVHFFEEKKDLTPVYKQIVVDEFQDFNLLEVSLINLLAEKSPILLAGDDDQALYDFKHASATHIRDRHGGSDYDSFSLPYCSRCTRVIVEAGNDIVKSAQRNGHLKNRIQKPYIYFDEEQKNAESAKYQRLIYGQRYPKQFPWTIDTEIQKFAEDQKAIFSALIITPTSTQCRDIASALQAKGFRHVSYREREAPEPTLLDGLMLILERKHEILGWRIVARHLLDEPDFVAALRACNCGAPFGQFLEKGLRLRIKRILQRLRQVKDAKIDADGMKELLAELNIDPYEAARIALADDLDRGLQRNPGAARNVPIQVTTIPSSKGLAADLVFITYFDDQYFIRDADKTKVCDLDICNFLVALTRARRKCVLVSSNQKEPLFLRWIDAARVARL